MASAVPPRAAVRTLLTGYADGGAPWVRAMAEPGDDGWFGPGSTIWAVHADAATLVGGIRALLVQAMHPTVLAGFDQHSDYREDPESRLQRTAAFVTVTTFGTSAQAEPTPVRGYAGRTPRCAAAPPTGEPYDAGDPELLGWVHLALADSLAVAVRATGGPRSTWTPTSPTWRSSGSTSAPPTSRSDAAGLAAAWAHYLPQLGGHRADRRGARVPARPAAAAADPRALPGDRRGGRRDACRPTSRPLLSGRPLLPDLPGPRRRPGRHPAAGRGTRREPRRGGRPPPYDPAARS